MLDVTARQRQPEVAGVVRPPMCAPQTCIRQFRGDAVGPELARHLGEHLLAVGEVDGQVKRRRPAPAAPLSPQPHLDALLVGVPLRDVLEGVEVEVGVEFAVDHRQHVAVEPRGHAGTVVVGTHQPAGVLDQVGAQQQAVAGLQRLRQRGQEFGARPRCQIADRRAEERDQPPADAGNLAEVFLEIAAYGVDFDARVLAAGWPTGGVAAPKHPRRTG